MGQSAQPASSHRNSRSCDDDPARDGPCSYHPAMTISLLSYSVGNEHDPGDPWGRSELGLQPDGSARLDHFFSRRGPAGAWTGRVDEAALRTLWSALEQAGFPAAP